MISCVITQLALVNWKRVVWIAIVVWVVFNQGAFENPEWVE